MARTRPYLFYDTATSICPTCFRRVEAKILFQDGKVLLRRWCPRHGGATALLADDVAYYQKARERWIKPPEMPQRYNTPMRFGCPYDCGLCPDHEQHSCLSIVEVTDHCNLRCPVCYAGSGPERQRYRSLAEIEAMLDAVVTNELQPDVVQISGGEPTLHPDFWAILDAAKARPIRHLMLNTNGVKLAADRDFVERLASYQPGFEVYLQFDSLREGALRNLRGKDLRAVREQALDHLDAFGIHTTLVCTLKKGVNDDELGDIVDFALSRPCVRGVTFQPIQDAGRNDGFDPATDRLTLTEVRRGLLEQSPHFTPDDVLPVPCHPDALAMAYGVRTADGGLVPLTHLVPREVLLASERSTISFEKDDAVRDHLFKLLSTNHSPDSAAGCLSDLLCCLPQVEVPEDWSYERVFRVIILQFADAWSFDLRSIKRSCVHFAQPDGRLIPFETYNLFYRDGLEEERLAPLRAELFDPMADRAGAQKLPSS